LLPLLQLLCSPTKKEKKGKKQLCPNMRNSLTLFIKTSHPSTKFKISKGGREKIIELMSL
jgi:hypothetical protein